MVMLFWPLISTVWTRLRAGNRALEGSGHAST
jgi:hypothetical protein